VVTDEFFKILLTVSSSSDVADFELFNEPNINPATKITPTPSIRKVFWGCFGFMP
jgi:hypothetical protein